MATSSDGAFSPQFMHLQPAVVEGYSTSSRYSVSHTDPQNGTVSLALAVPALIIALPPALIGAGIGAIYGASSNKSNQVKGIEEGAKLGFKSGALVVGILWMIPELALSIPKAIVHYTIGSLGAGLCAFAADRTSKQLNSGDILHNEANNPRIEKEKKIMDQLIQISFPLSRFS
jgi:hypothetical protein